MSYYHPSPEEERAQQLQSLFTQLNGYYSQILLYEGQFGMVLPMPPALEHQKAEALQNINRIENILKTGDLTPSDRASQQSLLSTYRSNLQLAEEAMSKIQRPEIMAMNAINEFRRILQVLNRQFSVFIDQEYEDKVDQVQGKLQAMGIM